MNLCISSYLYACIHPIFTLSLLSSGYYANHYSYRSEIQSLPWRRLQSSLMTRQERKLSAVIERESAVFMLAQGAAGAMSGVSTQQKVRAAEKTRNMVLGGPEQLARPTQSGRK